MRGILVICKYVLLLSCCFVIMSTESFPGIYRIYIALGVLEFGRILLRLVDRLSLSLLFRRASAPVTGRARFPRCPAEACYFPTNSPAKFSMCAVNWHDVASNATLIWTWSAPLKEAHRSFYRREAIGSRISFASKRPRRQSGALAAPPLREAAGVRAG